MMQQEINKVDKNILIRLAEYCRYMYEEEKERTNRLNDAVKVYIAFLTFTLGIVVFKMGPIKKMTTLSNSMPLHTCRILGVVLFYVSLFVFPLFYLYSSCFKNLEI